MINEDVKDLLITAMERHDRSISIYIFPDGEMTIYINPWPDSEEGMNNDNQC